MDDRVGLQVADPAPAPSGAPGVPPRLRPVALSLVVPTFNERDNVALLVERLRTVLAGIEWEVIFVDDDSADGTADAVRAIAQSDPRVRCLQRIGRRGLSSACIEGMLASASPVVAVMDADLQHDERLLPHMLDLLRRTGCDLVVGSRYVAGGGVGDWDARRARISAFSNRLSRLVCKVTIADPMSGYFMIRRDAFDATVRRLSGQGFKILLDILASSPRPLTIEELPYQFGERRFGESKLDTLVAWEFVQLIADKLVGHIVPVRFALFTVIGTLGLCIHFVVLWYAFRLMHLRFDYAQALAAGVAMTSNFFLNNLFTYRDKRLKGWRIVSGLLSFYCICAIGAAANVGIASYLFSSEQKWWLAGLVGVLVGAVWNYALSSIFTWKR